MTDPIETDAIVRAFMFCLYISGLLIFCSIVGALAYLLPGPFQWIARRLQ